MIDFEGYYLVPPDQVAYIETRRGGGDAQYGLFLGLSGGKELGVWYRTEEARKAAYTKLARQVEIGKRQDREDILYRLRLIEACINKTDMRRGADGQLLSAPAARLFELPDERRHHRPAANEASGGSAV